MGITYVFAIQEHMVPTGSKTVREPQIQNPSHKPAKPFAWRKRFPHLLAYIFAVMVLILMREAENGSPVPENSAPEEYFMFFSPNFVYERLVGIPQSPAKHVAVIIIGKDTPKTTVEPTVSKRKEIAAKPKEVSLACKRRLYIARLLNVLAAFVPKVVVLDMWFEPDSCSDLDSQTLWNELDSISKKIPVVSGIGSYNLSEILSNWPAELAGVTRRQSKIQPTELVSIRAINPVHSSSGKIIEGVVELDSDSRKIPLSWPVYESFATVGTSAQPRRIDSLSIAAVRAVDPQSPILARVGALDVHGSQLTSPDPFPYTSFLREEDLPIFRADEVICSSSLAANTVREECHSTNAGGPDFKMLFNGKVVLIGFAGFGPDVHKSLIGNVPGVVLQANYVESLLENRVYNPIPTPYQILIWIVWLGILFSIPLMISRSGWVLCSLLVAIILPTFLIHLFVMHFRYYTPLLPTLILAGVGLLISRQIEKVLAKNEEGQ
jgi:hypothetical protein